MINFGNFIRNDCLILNLISNFSDLYFDFNNKEEAKLQIQ